MIKNSLFHLKSTFRSEDISIFILAFFSHVGKRLDKKAKVNFKIYDVTYWEKIITIYIYIYIGQYLKR